MSQLRQHATAVMQQGEAERRNWNPDVDSAHYKVYRWWLRRSGKRIQQENFCHYWRVVFIWAPLRAVAKPLLVILGLAVLAGIVWVAVTFGDTLLEILGLMGVSFAAAGYLMASARTVGQLSYELNDREFDEFRWNWLDKKPRTIKGLMTLVCLPVCIVVAVLVLVLGALYAIFTGLHQDYDVFNRAKDWFVGAHFSDNKWLRWIRPWLVLPATLVVLSFFSETARFFLVVCTLVAAVFGLIVLASYLSDRSRQRERRQMDERRRQNYDGVLQMLYWILHPEIWEPDGTNGYEKWRVRYDAYCRRVRYADPYDIDLDWHLRFATKRVARYLPKLNKPTVSALRSVPGLMPVEPSRWDLFWRGAGDFFVLLWSVILTKKWKICPRVVLPTEVSVSK